jgi:hypothetical protein
MGRTQSSIYWVTSSRREKLKGASEVFASPSVGTAAPSQRCSPSQMTGDLCSHMALFIRKFHSTRRTTVCMQATTILTVVRAYVPLCATPNHGFFRIFATRQYSSLRRVSRAIAFTASQQSHRPLPPAFRQKI